MVITWLSRAMRSVHHMLDLVNGTRASDYQDGLKARSSSTPGRCTTSLRRFPEIGREELFRFFTLTPADSAFIDPGRGRGSAAVARLAEQLRVDAEEIRSYGRRAKTRTDHLRLAAQYLG